MTAAVRVQLSRRKGWRMPPNTVKVDRTTPWGNPHVAKEGGPNGESPREYAVVNFQRMLAGYLMISGPRGLYKAQRAYNRRVRKSIGALRGKNLACWCPLDQPCHADVLLEIANR